MITKNLYVFNYSCVFLLQNESNVFCTNIVEYLTTPRYIKPCIHVQVLWCGVFKKGVRIFISDSYMAFAWLFFILRSMIRIWSKLSLFSVGSN